MRILVTIDVLSYVPAGGAGTVLFETTKRLAARGHEVHVICRRRTDLPDEGVIDDVFFHTYTADPSRAMQMFRGGTAVVGKIYKRLVKEAGDFHVLNCHHPLGPSKLLKPLARSRTPLVYMFHSPWAAEYETRRAAADLPTSGLKFRFSRAFRKKTEAKVLRRSQSVITLSKYMAEVLKEHHGFRPATMHVIPGGVDLERFSPAANRAQVRRRLGIPTNRVILLVVRSLIPRMGLAEMIEAFETVSQDPSNPLLLIGGRGPMLDALQQKAAGLIRSGHVRFLDFIPNEELHYYYQAADLCVMPSRELEGFGLVTLEAMACGTPVLGTRHGGTVEILEQFDPGFLVEADTNAIGIALRQHLADPMKLMDYRDRCREFVETTYSWDRTVDLLEEAFRVAADSMT
jgi:glycosyltransferase involved in cell wall biosynthesis